MRKPSATDFTITLPDVGDFVFARRTMGDLLKIRTNFLLLTGEQGNTDDELAFFGAFMSAYPVLAVSCPAGWEDIGAVDAATHSLNIISLSKLLRDKEDSFRSTERVPSTE